MHYIKINNFGVKCRLYPTREQAEIIDKILYGMRVAYNTTAYEIVHENELITKVGKKDPSVRWPNFAACVKKEWLDYLRENREAVNDVPATSLSSSMYGLFMVDLKKSYDNFHPETKEQARTKTGKLKFTKSGKPVMKKTEKPVKVPCNKWEPEYYSNKKPRQSFAVQTSAKGFYFKENSKSIFINVSRVGKIKARGWRYDLRFGDNHDMTFDEYFTKDKMFGVIVSKDNCGDYYASVKIPEAWKPVKDSDRVSEIGVDVGVRDIAVTSEGQKFKNRYFKKEELNHKKALNRRLSRRQGWANKKFRDAHEKNNELKPSKRYEETGLKLAKLERRIARRRENYNHNVTTEIVRGASFIGIESLDVKGMMENKYMANNLSDAAMSDVLTKLKYKADWNSVHVEPIGRWVPSTQLCHVCGYKNVELKDTRITHWTCPKCGTYHDRDINASINILNTAKAKYLESAV